MLYTGLMIPIVALIRFIPICFEFIVGLLVDIGGSLKDGWNKGKRYREMTTTSCDSVADQIESARAHDICDSE